MEYRAEDEVEQARTGYAFDLQTGESGAARVNTVVAAFTEDGLRGEWRFVRLQPPLGVGTALPENFKRSFRRYRTATGPRGVSVDAREHNKSSGAFCDKLAINQSGVALRLAHLPFHSEY